MAHLDDPSLMSPGERLRAIAALLVRGLQRFKHNSAQPPAQPPQGKEAVDDLR